MTKVKSREEGEQEEEGKDEQCGRKYKLKKYKSILENKQARPWRDHVFRREKVISFISVPLYILINLVIQGFGPVQDLRKNPIKLCHFRDEEAKVLQCYNVKKIQVFLLIQEALHCIMLLLLSISCS